MQLYGFGFVSPPAPPLFLICKILFMSVKFYLVSLVRTLRALWILIMSSSVVTLLVLHHSNLIKMSAFLYKSLIKTLYQRGLNTKSYGTTIETSLKLTLFHQSLFLGCDISAISDLIQVDSLYISPSCPQECHELFG